MCPKKGLPKRSTTQLIFNALEERRIHPKRITFPDEPRCDTKLHASRTYPKKGADSGIDGHIYFKPDGKTTEKAIVSVKGGDNVSVPMIRDLGHVVEREKAKIGLFITFGSV